MRPSVREFGHTGTLHPDDDSGEREGSRERHDCVLLVDDAQSGQPDGGCAGQIQRYCCAGVWIHAGCICSTSAQLASRGISVKSMCLQRSACTSFRVLGRLTDRIFLTVAGSTTSIPASFSSSRFSIVVRSLKSANSDCRSCSLRKLNGCNHVAIASTYWLETIVTC